MSMTAVDDIYFYLPYDYIGIGGYGSDGEPRARTYDILVMMRISILSYYSWHIFPILSGRARLFFSSDKKKKLV